MIEVLRYTACRVEYAIAGNGWLRAYVVLMGRIFCLLAVPCVVGGALAALAVPGFASLAAVAGYAEAATHSMLKTICWAALSVGAVAGFIAAIRMWHDRRRW